MRPATKPPLPKPMREDDDFVLARLVLAWRERAPEQRPRPEDVETVGRHPQAIDVLRLAYAREIQVGADERSETVECDALLFPVDEHAGRNRVLFAWGGRFPHLHELARLVVMERFQQHTIDDAKDGRVRPDAEREREHGHGGEAGGLQQVAEGTAKIVKHNK